MTYYQISRSHANEFRYHVVCFRHPFYWKTSRADSAASPSNSPWHPGIFKRPSVCSAPLCATPELKYSPSETRYWVSEHALYNFTNHLLLRTTVILDMYCRLALFLHLNKPNMRFKDGCAGKTWCFAGLWLMFFHENRCVLLYLQHPHQAMGHFPLNGI